MTDNFSRLLEQEQALQETLQRAIATLDYPLARKAIVEEGMAILPHFFGKAVRGPGTPMIDLLLAGNGGRQAAQEFLESGAASTEAAGVWDPDGIARVQRVKYIEKKLRPPEP